MPEVEVSVRKATLDDLDEIVGIENQVQVAPWVKDHFLAELDKPQSRFWVLTDDETDQVIYGYIVFWVVGGDGHIVSVVTRPQSRGLGYGELLVRQAVRHAGREGAEVIRLEVRHSNDAALRLYQKVGFTITQIRKGFYSNGESAYLMELQLNAAQTVDF